MFGSNPRLKIARPIDGIRSTEKRLHPVESSSSISPALSTVASGICSRPSRNRADARISGLISRGDLYSGPSRRSSTRSIGQGGAANDESREFPRVLGDRRVSPLLAQLRHLRGLTGDHPGARRVLAQDAPLQNIRRPVGVATRQKRHHLGARGQAGRHPEHAHGYDGPVLVGLQLGRPAAPARRVADRRRAAAARRPWSRDARGAGVPASR